VKGSSIQQGGRRNFFILFTHKRKQPIRDMCQSISVGKYEKSPKVKKQCGVGDQKRCDEATNGEGKSD